MGNGGFAGSIHRATLAAAAARGDAAAATDTGHQGTGFDAGWARGRPDLIEDYASRSIKVTADAARDLIVRYYGRPPAHRYFMGCSFGGRQALVAASSWPQDWDGIIAGAPAVRWIDWLAGFAAIQHQLRATPGGWIAPERISGLAGFVRTSDGPAGTALERACRRGRTAACLAPGQARSLAAIERAGYPLADADPAEWRRWIVNPDPAEPSQARFATGAFRYLFRDAPDWTIADYRVGDPISPAIRTLFQVGSLDRFLRRGGKLIAYVGTADAVLPPKRVIAALRERFGRSRQSGARLLVVPGMSHCQGGEQPHAFGQALSALALRDDPDHDIRRALEAWVERGRVPKSLVLATVGPSRPVTTRKLYFDRH